MCSRCCDYVVKIPTRFSVNLGVAGALIMYDRPAEPRPPCAAPGRPRARRPRPVELPVFGEPMYKRRQRGSAKSPVETMEVVVRARRGLAWSSLSAIWWYRRWCCAMHGPERLDLHAAGHESRRLGRRHLVVRAVAQQTDRLHAPTAHRSRHPVLLALLVGSLLPRARRCVMRLAIAVGIEVAPGRSPENSPWVHRGLTASRRSQRRLTGRQHPSTRLSDSAGA